MIRRYWAFFMILLFAASTVLAYQTSQNLKLAARGIESLSIDCGAGFLKVIGEKNRSTIQVSAAIRAQHISPARAKRVLTRDLELKLHRQGNQAVLVSHISSHRGYNIQINLTVHVPERLHLTIDDGSGEMVVQNIDGTVVINDGSGGIDLRDIGGSVQIEDGSGELTLDGAGANVHITDGSGEILVSHVAGDVTIDDNSGELRVTGVTGNVRIEDGSGDINIRDVDGNVNIVNDGSGDLNVSGVKGTIIKGQVRIDQQKDTHGAYVF